MAIKHGFARVTIKRYEHLQMQSVKVCFKNSITIIHILESWLRSAENMIAS